MTAVYETVNLPAAKHAGPAYGQRAIVPGGRLGAQSILLLAVCGRAFGWPVRGMRWHATGFTGRSSVERIVESLTAAFPAARPKPSAKQPDPSGTLARNFWPWLNCTGSVGRPPNTCNIALLIGDPTSYSPQPR